MSRGAISRVSALQWKLLMVTTARSLANDASLARKNEADETLDLGVRGRVA